MTDRRRALVVGEDTDEITMLTEFVMALFGPPCEVAAIEIDTSSVDPGLAWGTAAPRVRPGVSTFEIEFVTDPIDDDETQEVVRRLPGWAGFGGSELSAGGLDARLDVLARYGIAVHRVVGDHRAVERANQRLGYL